MKTLFTILITIQLLMTSIAIFTMIFGNGTKDEVVYRMVSTIFIWVIKKLIEEL